MLPHSPLLQCPGACIKSRFLRGLSSILAVRQMTYWILIEEASPFDKYVCVNCIFLVFRGRSVYDHGDCLYYMWLTKMTPVVPYQWRMWHPQSRWLETLSLSLSRCHALLKSEVVGLQYRIYVVLATARGKSHRLGVTSDVLGALLQEVGYRKPQVHMWPVAFWCQLHVVGFCHLEFRSDAKFLIILFNHLSSLQVTKISDWCANR